VHLKQTAQCLGIPLSAREIEIDIHYLAFFPDQVELLELYAVITIC
jgi:hypothetical protein